MPYVIFTANGEEYDRRELTRPLLLGRAPDCDIAIRDITLSRHHCRLEPSENGRAWQLVDLHSKNGSFFLGQKVETHVLRDKDELRVGRTRLTFRAGEFVPSGKAKNRAAVARPVDPHEALAGTVTGMVVCEPGETETYEGMPVPQPRPVDPRSFEKDDIYGMINEIASNSWDSIQAQASQPTRMQRATPTPAVTTAADRAPARPAPCVSFALQAEPTRDDDVSAAATAAAAAAATATSQPAIQRPPRPGQPTPQPVAATATIATDAAPATSSAVAATQDAAAAHEVPAAQEPEAALSLSSSPAAVSSGISEAIAAASAAARAASARSRSRTRARIAALWHALAEWRLGSAPQPSQRVLMALATTAAVGLLFFGYVSLLLYMTSDARTPAPRPLPESPAAMPDLPKADQPAAMVLPFADSY